MCPQYGEPRLQSVDEDSVAHSFENQPPRSFIFGLWTALTLGNQHTVDKEQERLRYSCDQ